MKKLCVFALLLVTTVCLAKDNRKVASDDVKPDGYFNCPIYTGLAKIDERYMGSFSDKWADKGGSMTIAFAPDKVKVADKNVVTCYYPYPENMGWAVRQRTFSEFSYCEQGQLPTQFQCFK